MRTTTITILFFLSTITYGQSISKYSIWSAMYNQIINNDSTGDWKLIEQDTCIKYILIDTIYFEPGCCGLSITKNDLRRIDTVFLTLRFEKGWDLIKIDSVRKENIKIITFLSNDLIRYCDSLKWRVKIEKKSFLDYPYSTLKTFRDFNKKGGFDIAKVVRLPDKLINDIGIFVDLSFDYSWFTIYQGRPREQLTNKLEFVSFDILNAKKMITGRFEYE